MKNNFVLFAVVALLILSCSKKATVESNGFTKYTIAKGKQYADISGYKSADYSELKFVVKFDSSAIYTTITPDNQFDINKLYGFSDNSTGHHQFSARFGWRWSDKALRLFGYVYNKGVRDSKELGIVNIGSEKTCSIKVSGDQYIFSLNGKTDYLPRASTTPTATGYKLFPYFGGDELAPHNIFIWIKEL